MLDDNEKPATKADIAYVKADIVAVRADMTAVRADITDVKADISLLATKTELACLDKKIDRVAAALVNTQENVREIRNDMATKMATKDDISRVLSAIDAFTKKSEINDNAVVLHGRALTDVQVGLKDHEGRLKTLEAARP
ncbi:MAG: hypothetical protein AAB268_12820 [Elusimicrobiota bacterium]